MFCKYKDIFGKPNEGVHRHRFMNIAIVDLLMTIVLAFFVSKYFDFEFVMTIIVLLVLSLIVHKLFCVDTYFVFLFNSLFS